MNKNRLFALLIVLVMLCVSGCSAKSSGDLSYYRALSGESDGADMMSVFGDEFDMPCPYSLPLLSELEPYRNTRFDYTAKSELFFQSHAYVLIVEYDEATYPVQKAALEGKYAFCTEQSQGFSNGDMTEPSYTMDEFEIRAVEGGDYPKEMLLLGFSDTKQEVAIIYFYDQDLDYIDDPLGKFIGEYTGWDKVV